MNTAKDRLLSDIRRLAQELAQAATTNNERRWRTASRALARVERSLARPLRLAIFGEANTGKSSLVNLVLKRAVVPAGGFAGQGAYLRIHHASDLTLYAVKADGGRNRLTSKAFAQIAEPEAVAAPSMPSVIYNAGDHHVRAPVHGLAGHHYGQRTTPGKLLELGVPHDLLREVEIVEARSRPEGRLTSGLAAAFRPADVTIWCTLATQAWKETERATWARIPAGRRGLALMLVTYRDAVRNPKDEAKILARLQHDAVPPFAEVLMVSLRDALEAGRAADEETATRLRARSNAEAVEAAIDAAIAAREDRRTRRAAQALGRIAAVLRLADGGGRGGAGHTFAAMLEKLGGGLDFPAISDVR